MPRYWSNTMASEALQDPRNSYNPDVDAIGMDFEPFVTDMHIGEVPDADPHKWEAINLIATSRRAPAIEGTKYTPVAARNVTVYNNKIEEYSAAISLSDKTRLLKTEVSQDQEMDKKASYEMTILMQEREIRTLSRDPSSEEADPVGARMSGILPYCFENFEGPKAKSGGSANDAKLPEGGKGSNDTSAIVPGNGDAVPVTQASINEMFSKLKNNHIRVRPYSLVANDILMEKIRSFTGGVQLTNEQPATGVFRLSNHVADWKSGPGYLCEYFGTGFMPAQTQGANTAAGDNPAYDLLAVDPSVLMLHTLQDWGTKELATEGNYEGEAIQNWSTISVGNPNRHWLMLSRSVS